jgi:hypothetical protein
MAEEMIRELIKSQEKENTGMGIANSVIVRKPGEEPKLLKGDEIEKELVRMGLYLELSDLDEEGLIAVFDSRKSFVVSGHKYVFCPVMVVHKGKEDTECLSEEEICRAVIELMEAEETLTYDNTDFKAYRLW